jgi:hypothetical protein
MCGRCGTSAVTAADQIDIHHHVSNGGMRTPVTAEQRVGAEVTGPQALLLGRKPCEVIRYPLPL